MTRRISALLPAIALVLLAPAAGPLAAQPTLDRVTSGFEINGDYLVEIDGVEVPTAEVYYSRQAGAFLVLPGDAPGSPVLLWPRTGRAETVDAAKVSRRADGLIDVLSDATTPAGSFRVVGGDVSFTIDGRDARLRERPYLLGSQSVGAVAGSNPAYARGAELYSPSDVLLQELREKGAGVKVEVYFGSWCPACKQMVPRIVRVASELEGSEIEFEFYGLPKPFAGEPRAEDRGVTGVPTGIVYQGDQEVGRLTGNDWRVPEQAILGLIG